ncbi:hypothetical protein MASR1M74_06340 [Lentimicrobium sp.]
MRRLVRQLLMNIVCALGVFFISLDWHSQISVTNIKQYGPLIAGYFFIHFFTSLVYRKYESDHYYTRTQLYTLYFRTWMVSTGLLLLFIYVFQYSYLSRFIILTNIFGLFLTENLLLNLFFLIRNSTESIDKLPDTAKDVKSELLRIDEAVANAIPDIDAATIAELGEESLHFVSEIMQRIPGKAMIFNTTTSFNILSRSGEGYTKIINLRKLNDVRYINKFLEAINQKLPLGGYMAVCAETKNQRKQRLLKKYPPLLNYVYYSGDFFVKRVLPKIPVAKKMYFFLTRGLNRVISRAEILGRVISCGFTIVDEKKMNGAIFVIAQKTGVPAFNEHATYGPLIYLNRIGKNGKMIKVYKFRTMHPYSEYLQEYIYNNNNLCANGKIKDDYRVTRIGKLARKFWIDELPMLINLMRGELKLVGVRPLSKHYFSLYTPELQQLRIRTRPGLIPPFYVDMPNTLEEIQASELRYLQAYAKHPLRTDIKYFFVALRNIIFKKARSS